MVAARERIAELLSVRAAPITSVPLMMNDSGLRLEVDGVGRIRWPVSAEAARQLVAAAAHVRYGKGEQPLTCPGVRDTWELPAASSRIRRRGWCTRSTTSTPSTVWTGPA